jgi:uncharacterized protein (DUF849 family)
VDWDERLLASVDRWRVLPDYASVNLSEKVAPVLIQKLHQRGIAIEAGLARIEDAERLLQLGLEQFALRILIEVGEQDLERAHGVTGAILAVLGRSSVQKPLLLHGVDASAWPLLHRALESGFSTRIGLEDASIFPDGSLAGSNAELVAAAIRSARTGLFSRYRWKVEHVLDLQPAQQSCR